VRLQEGLGLGIEMLAKMVVSRHCRCERPHGGLQTGLCWGMAISGDARKVSSPVDDGADSVDPVEV
jgi:hypothetical protein